MQRSRRASASGLFARIVAGLAAQNVHRHHVFTDGVAVEVEPADVAQIARHVDPVDPAFPHRLAVVGGEGAGLAMSEGNLDAPADRVAMHRFQTDGEDIAAPPAGEARLFVMAAAELHRAHELPVAARCFAIGIARPVHEARPGAFPVGVLHPARAVGADVGGHLETRAAAGEGVAVEADAADFTLVAGQVYGPVRAFAQLAAVEVHRIAVAEGGADIAATYVPAARREAQPLDRAAEIRRMGFAVGTKADVVGTDRLEEHTSELQSHSFI